VKKEKFLGLYNSEAAEGRQKIQNPIPYFDRKRRLGFSEEGEWWNDLVGGSFGNFGGTSGENT